MTALRRVAAYLAVAVVLFGLTALCVATGATSWWIR
jgi:hypothetical protein